MNFVKYTNLDVRLSRRQALFGLFLITLLSLSFTGCSDQVKPSSANQLVQFEKAGPVHPTEQMDPSSVNNRISKRIIVSPSSFSPGIVSCAIGRPGPEEKSRAF